MCPILWRICYATLEERFLTKEKDNTVNCLLKRLVNFESVILELQFEATLLLDALALFDDVADKYPCLKPRLKDYATTIENANFEQVIVNVQHGHDNALELVERKAIRRFFEMAAKGPMPSLGPQWKSQN